MKESPHGLAIYRSNRLERLAQALAELLAEPPEDPFAPEVRRALKQLQQQLKRLGSTG